MASVPPSARVVVIGAGIVGNSLVHHLARLGWRDIVQIDKGALPNPGGSTGHASNFIFPVDHSREMADLTMDSVRQYKELGVFTQSGGYEVARTEERMEELRRRMSSAKAWGIEAELVSPDHVVVQGAVPGQGQDPRRLLVPDGRRRRLVARRHADARVARWPWARSPWCRPSRSPGWTSSGAGSAGCAPTGGDIEAETVVIACGVWSPKIAKMAGAAIPLTPAVHQMISVGPVPQLAEREGEISFPIIRDMDTFCYERQHGADMEVGSYAHRAILHNPEDIPSIEQSKLSPTEMPFTEDDFDPQLEQALELMPDALGADGAEIRYAINGLLSLTPDGSADPGRDPRGQGPLVGRRGVDQGGPGHRPRGRRVDDPRLLRDRRPATPTSRASTRTSAPASTCARAPSEAFNKTYGIVHPSEQWDGERGKRLAPMHAAEKEAGAVFFETAGWERPMWYASNEALLGEYGDAVMPREHEWDSRWWSPIINAEHLAMRERAGIFDLSAFAIFDIVGPGRQGRGAGHRGGAGRRAGGPGHLHPGAGRQGGFRSDLTVMRLAHDRYRVVTGGAHGMADLKWFSDHLPADGRAQIVDVTSAYTTIGLWGPRARDILGGLTDDDLSPTPASAS